ncbi:hypothetical protein KC318_g10835 [Hortaea werneckii]|nr:hypothetical protein KC334_g8400 [Hortaea werneckii]KAI7004933.1 hypothetical protein KC355_g8467 [Hortaea werneckii]KAI7170997.1 hypothetical protein KC324_g11041 [Hortaea werneckii]KAI7566214.1 hypothetical protein KC316_g12500 [Hortaea werneckii]KAI7659121.1 hypothetical protein KC318_g10835 [Hortaea werneckii]
MQLTSWIAFAFSLGLAAASQQAPPERRNPPPAAYGGSGYSTSNAEYTRHDDEDDDVVEPGCRADYNRNIHQNNHNPLHPDPSLHPDNYNRNLHHSPPPPDLDQHLPVNLHGHSPLYNPDTVPLHQNDLHAV